MESLKKVVAQIMSQMRGMTLSQRLTLALGAMLVAGSVAWMAQWAASPDMVPLLAQDLSQEELTSVSSVLDRMNEPYEISGSRVMVRGSANRYALLAQIQQDSAMPGDVSLGFSTMVQDANPWISRTEQSRRWTVAWQSELARTLSEFDDVKSARVFLNLDAQTKFGRSNAFRPTATVSLEMKGGAQVSRQMAAAARRFVSGAVGKGLTPDAVQVVDHLGRVAPGADDDTDGSRVFREQVQQEQRIRSKVLAMVPDPNALIDVRVELNLTERQVHNQEVTDGAEVTNRTENLEETNTHAGGAPGVDANTGVDVGGATGRTSRLTQNTAETKSEPSRKETVESTPAGEAREIYAAISLSDLYLASIYRRNNPDGEDPTEEQLQEVFEKQLPKIERTVGKLLKAEGSDSTEKLLGVDWHYQLDSMGTAVAASSVDDAIGWAKNYGPQAGMAVLALASLGLMLRLAKKTGAGESFGMEIGLPQEAIDAAKQAAKDIGSAAAQRAAADKRRAQSQTIQSSSAAAPMSEATEGVLTAQEVDESAVQVTKMVEQVSEFVNEDSETVSSLFERWIETSD